MDNVTGIPLLLSILTGTAIIISVSGLAEVILTIIRWIKRENKFTNSFYSLWSISIALLIAWVIQVDIL